VSAGTAFFPFLNGMLAEADAVAPAPPDDASASPAAAVPTDRR